MHISRLMAFGLGFVAAGMTMTLLGSGPDGRGGRSGVPLDQTIPRAPQGPGAPCAVCLWEHERMEFSASDEKKTFVVGKGILHKVLITPNESFILYDAANLSEIDQSSYLGYFQGGGDQTLEIGVDITFTRGISAWGFGAPNSIIPSVMYYRAD